MRLSVCLLVLAALAPAWAAYVYQIDGRIGYPTPINAHNGAWFYAKWNLAATDIPVSPRVLLEVTIDPINTASTATIEYYFTNTASNPTIADTKLGTKARTDSSNTFTIIVQEANATIPSTGAIYSIGGLFTCGATCLGESDIKISGRLLWDGIAQPFKAVQDPFTSPYSVPQAAFGLATYVDIVAPTKIYIKLETGALSGLSKVVIVYKATTPPLTTADFTAATDKYPVGSPTSGGYSTGPKELTTPGRWYIAPYCAESTGTGINCAFDFAVGIGMEPAAAAGLLPSFFLVSLLSLLALVAL